MDVEAYSLVALPETKTLGSRADDRDRPGCRGERNGAQSRFAVACERIPEHRHPRRNGYPRTRPEPVKSHENTRALQRARRRERMEYGASQPLAPAGHMHVPLTAAATPALGPGRTRTSSSPGYAVPLSRALSRKRVRQRPDHGPDTLLIEGISPVPPPQGAGSSPAARPDIATVAVRMLLRAVVRLHCRMRPIFDHVRQGSGVHCR